MRPRVTTWASSLTRELRLSEAVAAFREAIVHKPDFAQAHWNLSLALLTQGHYKAGWREYAWRESITRARRAGAHLHRPALGRHSCARA